MIWHLILIADRNHTNMSNTRMIYILPMNYNGNGIRNIYNIIFNMRGRRILSINLNNRMVNNGPR